MKRLRKSQAKAVAMLSSPNISSEVTKAILRPQTSLTQPKNQAPTNCPT